MDNRKVKGTMLIDYVRMVRKIKDRDWDKYLKPEDWEIVNRKVLPSMWFPYDSFQRIGVAVFHEISMSNIDTVRAFGKVFWNNLFSNVYGSIISDKNPVKCLERFALLRSAFFNFATHDIRKLGDTHVQSVITVGELIPGLEPFCAQLQGGMDAIMDHADAKNPKIELIEREWKKDPATVFDITWE